MPPRSALPKCSDRTSPAAGVDVEGVGWFQYGIREALPQAGVAPLCEARAECLHDPRCRSALDTGTFQRNLRPHSGPHQAQEALGRDLPILFHGSHSTSVALTSPAPSGANANLTTAGPFVRSGHSNATSPQVVPPGATAFA